jgi:hypothetical protein
MKQGAYTANIVAKTRLLQVQFRAQFWTRNLKSETYPKTSLILLTMQWVWDI